MEGLPLARTGLGRVRARPATAVAAPRVEVAPRLARVPEGYGGQRGEDERARRVDVRNFVVTRRVACTCM